jgi:homoserine O-acetyltransferase
MSTLVPMACQPAAMSGRNWMLRRMFIETIKADPAWNNGNYTAQPPSLKFASVYFSLTTSNGTQHLHAMAPTRAQADKVVEERLAQRFGADANNLIYSYDADDYDPPVSGKYHARVSINWPTTSAIHPNSESSIVKSSA